MSNDNDIERRVLIEGLEVRRSREELPVIRGYAAVWGSLSSDLGGFKERISRGAFAESIKADDVRALANHDPGQLLGRMSAGTLKLREDAKGLAVEIVPPDTSAGRDTVASVERGDLTGMSFAFRTIDDSWEVSNGGQIRTLKSVRLREVSIVSFPAYPDTSVACRSLEDHKQAELKRSEAEYLASRRAAVAKHKG